MTLRDDLNARLGGSQLVRLFIAEPAPALLFALQQANRYLEPLQALSVVQHLNAASGPVGGPADHWGAAGGARRRPIVELIVNFLATAANGFAALTKLNGDLVWSKPGGVQPPGTWIHTWPEFLGLNGHEPKPGTAAPDLMGLYTLWPVAQTARVRNAIQGIAGIDVTLFALGASSTGLAPASHYVDASLMLAADAPALRAAFPVGPGQPLDLAHVTEADAVMLWNNEVGQIIDGPIVLEAGFVAGENLKIIPA